ncbi:MAG: hypothetical protein ACLT5P_01935 [Flavonifractor plautii]
MMARRTEGAGLGPAPSASVRALSSTTVRSTGLGLQALGYETIIINNNPETVSTDFDRRPLYLSR